MRSHCRFNTKGFHKIGMAIMNWPERTKDSKTFIVVRKWPTKGNFEDFPGWNTKKITYFLTFGCGVTFQRGSLKVTAGGNSPWNCFGGMTTKTIKIWLNLYRWIRNCMNFVKIWRKLWRKFWDYNTSYDTFWSQSWKTSTEIQKDSLYMKFIL